MSRRPRSGKCRPYPKVRNPKTGFMVLDVEKLHELYLKGSNLTFKAFCEAEQFNYESALVKNAGIDLNAWKREWIANKCEIQDDEVAPDYLAARQVVNKQRARFVIDWNNRAQAMKKMLDFMLNQEMENMRWDMENTLKIQAGAARRRTTMQPKDFDTLAATAQRLQDLESKSLLLMPVKFENQPGSDVKIESDTKPPEFEFHTMGAAGMKAEEITALMAGYFDQNPNPTKAVEDQSAVDAHTQDQG